MEKIANPLGLGTALPPQEQGPKSFTSGISRPRPTVKPPKTVDTPKILPFTPVTSITSALSHFPTEPPPQHLSPQNSQVSSNAQTLDFPNPPAQPSRVTHHTPHTQPSQIPKPNSNPHPSTQSSTIPQPSQSPEPTVMSPNSSADNKFLLKKPVNDDDDGFRVYIVTWNVGSAMPPDDISGLFGPRVSDRSTDMFIVGLQEVNSMINKRLKDVLFTDQWSELCMDTLSRFGYVLVASQRMQGVLLLVFSKFCYLPFLRGVQTQSTRTGLGGYWGNKGGVSARMMLFGHPVCFLNCHLPAHMRNLEQRVEDFESILQQQQFEGGAAVGVLDHEWVSVSGLAM